MKLITYKSDRSYDTINTFKIWRLEGAGVGGYPVTCYSKMKVRFTEKILVGH